MPPEMLQDGISSKKSDVVSWGLLFKCGIVHVIDRSRHQRIGLMQNDNIKPTN